MMNGNAAAMEFRFVVLVGLLAFGAIAVAVAPRHVNAVKATLLRAPWTIIGIGLLTPIVLVMLTVVLAITVLGAPVAALLWVVGLPIGALFGITAITVLIGERLFVVTNTRPQAMMVNMIVGVLLILVVTVLPIIGWVLLGLCGLFGLGAVILTLYSYWMQRRARHRAQAAPPPPPPR